MGKVGLTLSLLALAVTISLAGVDTDGDGVPDDVDVCPDVFNPGQNQPIRLNPALGSQDDVVWFALSDDGQYAVFLVERGKLISALYTCAYAGTLPVVALGYLSQAIGLTAALGVCSLAALSLAAFVVLVGGRNFRTVVPHPEAMGRMEELAA